jgi:pimeloyl-ACP methyl ester carboxylesterase
VAISDVLGARRTARLGAGAIEYRERGGGAPIVFAHGAGVNGDLWRRVAPALSGEWRCIVPDLPLGGHSLPLAGAPDRSLPGQARILAAFLDALELRDVTLIGNDTGGAISQALVATRPERVARLVLTSCDAFRNYPPRAVAWLKPACRVPALLGLVAHAAQLKPVQRLPVTYGWATRTPIEPRIMESYVAGLRASAGVRRDFAALLAQARRDDMQRASEGVAAFAGPALVVWADDDRFFPRAHGRRLAELMPRGRFELVERSRTFIPEDNPEPLVRLVRDLPAD